MTSLSEYVWIFLIVYLVISVINTLMDVWYRVKLKIYFSDYNKIHEKSSSTWHKVEKLENPNLLDLLLDIKYLLKNFRKKWRDLGRTLAFFMCITIITSPVAFVYSIVFLTSLWALVLYIIFSLIINKTTAIEGDNFLPEVKKRRDLYKVILSSPIKWAFLILYIFLGLRKFSKLPQFNGLLAICPLLFHCPLWIFICSFRLSVAFSRKVTSREWGEKSWKGKGRCLIAVFNDEIEASAFRIALKINPLLSERRIIIENRRIRLNGKTFLTPLLKYKEIIEHPKYMIPAKVKFNQINHQAWIKEEGSNEALTMSSKEKIKTSQGDFRNTKLEYGWKVEKQFYVPSEINLSETEYTRGSIPIIMSKHGFHDRNILAGFILRLNLFSKFYASKQVLYQRGDEKTLIELKDPVKIENLYSKNLREDLEINKIKEEETAAMRKVILMTNQELFRAVNEEADISILLEKTDSLLEEVKKH